MNFTRRAFTYMLRKKGKTVSLLLLVFVTAVFLISCFRVLNASERLRRDIRNSVGAAFYIRANTEVSIKENGEAEVKENHIRITQKEIDKVMRSGEIKYCNPINYGFAKSDKLQFIRGDKHTPENNMGKVTALRFSALAPDFTNKTAVLSEGSHITEADSGKIVISERLADENHLSVGDSLVLTHAKFGESDGEYIDEIPVKTAYVKVRISGIYKLNIANASVKPTAGVAENEIYASLDVLNELHESKAGIYTGEVDFYITDPEKLSGITRNVKELQSIDWTTHFVRTNDLGYSKIADRLSSLGDLAKILLVLVSVVSGLILTLLLTMRMRGRMQEAGILLSIGIPKCKIMAGFLLEVLSAAVMALIFAYIVSLAVREFLGDYLFREMQPNLLNDGTLIAEAGVRTPDYLKLSSVETVFIFSCQLIVIAASTFVSSIMIMRLKPKEILSKIS